MALVVAWKHLLKHGRHHFRPLTVSFKKLLHSEGEHDHQRNASQLKGCELSMERILLHPSIRGQQHKLHRLWALHGRQSHVDPRTIWPSVSELERKKALEDKLFPSLQEMVKVVQTAEVEEKALKQQRDKTIAEKHGKLNQLIDEFRQRQQVKLQLAEAQRAEKQKMLEEIRAYLGFRVDPKDERFQQMVEQKEREQAKAAKDARKKEKIARELAKLEADAKAAQEERLKGQSDST